MTASLSVPGPADLAELLTMLLGRDVQVEASDQEADPALLGWYEHDDGSPAAVIVGDLPSAVVTGAALSMLPPGVAAEALAAGAVDDTVRANFAEVLNIGANLFMAEGGAHLRLVSTHDASAAPDPAQHLVASPGRRSDLRITVAGYGSGVMSFRTAA